jgi:hypothetical protein
MNAKTLQTVLELVFEAIIFLTVAFFLIFVF